MKSQTLVDFIQIILSLTFCSHLLYLFRNFNKRDLFVAKTSSFKKFQQALEKNLSWSNSFTIWYSFRSFYECNDYSTENMALSAEHNAIVVCLR